MSVKSKQGLKKYVVYLLSRREYSKLELVKKLKQFSNDDNIINDIISEFSNKSLQSDLRFCESFIHSKKNKYGTLKMIYELKNKGIDKNLYAKLLPLPEEEVFIASKILHNKYRNVVDNFECKRKYINFLLSRGFNIDIITKAIKLIGEKD